MGRSKKQTVGHKYEFGEVFVIASNPVSVLELQYQDKLAWRGRARGGQTMQVDEPVLFGGDDVGSEGGVSGLIDVQDGNASQGVNDYLASVISGIVPTYRYLSTLVYRRFYHGNSPYPKAPKIKVMDAGLALAFEPDYCWFPRSYDTQRAEIYIGIDVSASMEDNNRFENAKAGVALFLRTLKGTINSVRVHFVRTDTADMMTKVDCTDADYEALAVWVEAYVQVSSQFYTTKIVAGLSTFLTGRTGPTPEVDEDNTLAWANIFGRRTVVPSGRRVAILISDGGLVDYITGKPLLDAIGNLERFCINVHDTAGAVGALAHVDNTAEDGVPSGRNADHVANLLRTTVATWLDQNPMHMMFDAITVNVENDHPDTSMLGATFSTVAKVLYEEGFGLSFTWRNGSDIGSFKKKIEEHIDGRIFVSRATGKWEVKLHRADYDIETLPTLDVLEWKDDVVRELISELPNKIVMTYRKQENGEKRSITLSNPSSISITQGTRPDKVDFDGCYDHTLAARILAREVQARTQPKWSGTVVVGSVPKDFDLGSEFKLYEPLLGITEPIVCRAAEITYETGQSRNVTIKFIEDKFSLSNQVDLDALIPEVPATAAIDPVSFVQETPYYLLVLEVGQTQVTSNLADQPTQGFYMLGAAAPNNYHLDFSVNYSIGAGWFLEETADFCPSQTLAADVSELPTETIIHVANTGNLDLVEAGSLALLGSEFVRVDSVEVVGADVLLTVGRGCLDTAPNRHAAGATIFFFQNYNYIEETQYLAGEEVLVRLQPRTTTDQLELAACTTHSVEFNERAIRPLRPANLKIESGFEPLNIWEGSATLTWSHQNRLTQTTSVPEDYLSASIGPEAGVAYRLDITVVDEDLNHLADVTSIDVGTGTSYTVTFDLLSVRPEDAAYYKFAVYSVRDGLDSWVPAVVLCSAFAPVEDIIVEEI